jgi:nicotinate-nucleotide pyrophosphorylase (carboxylating)
MSASQESTTATSQTTLPDFSALLPPHWKREVENWVQDDCPSIDIGGLVVGDKVEDATLYGKSKGILAGVPFYNGKMHTTRNSIIRFHH